MLACVQVDQPDKPIPLPEWCRCLLTVYWLCTGCVLVVYWLCTDCVLNAYWLHAGRAWTAYWLCIDCALQQIPASKTTLVQQWELVTQLSEQQGTRPIGRPIEGGNHCNPRMQASTNLGLQSLSSLSWLSIDAVVTACCLCRLPIDAVVNACCPCRLPIDTVVTACCLCWRCRGTGRGFVYRRLRPLWVWSQQVAPQVVKGISWIQGCQGMSK